MKTFAVAASLILSSISIAYADDGGAPMGSGFNWSGGYVGAAVGYGFDQAITATDPDDYNSDAPFDFDAEGFSGGLFAGYGYQFETGIYLGAEAEVGYIALEGQAQGTDAVLNGAPLNDSLYTIDGGAYAALSARIGVAMDRTLVFAKAGVIGTGIEGGFIDNDTSVLGLLTAPASETFDLGFLVAAGIDHAFTDNIIGRIEGQYVSLGDVLINTSVINRGNRPVSFGIEGVDAFNVRFGLSVLFH